MKITLAAIVGNEELVIERFIRSFAPAVDSIYLVRAIGNQRPDNTIEFATRVCQELNIPLTWSTYSNDDMPHVDSFANARNWSWQRAEGTFYPDYILWADADDVLEKGAAESIRAAAESASHEVFIMPYHVRGDKQIVHRERMVKASVGSRWQYAIHEQLTFPRDVTYRVIKDAVFLHSPLAGKTGSHERNIRILENELRDAPRNLFYLAQQYFQVGNEREFVKAAKSALSFDSLGDIEHYELILNLAQTPGQESKKLAAEAHALMPDRREAIALLCNYAILDADFPKALRLATMLIETPAPKVTYWSQNNEWYGWKADELYKQCLRLNQKPEIADAVDALREDQTRPRFSIIHATLGRPDKALAIRELWLSRAKSPENVEYIYGLHTFDKPSVRFLSGFKHTLVDEKGAAINYDAAAGLATGDIIIQAQDDCYPPEGWDERMEELIPDTSKPVFVATFDGHRDDRLSVNTIMTRAYMDIKAKRDPGENGFFHRGYVTVFPDTENSFRAIKDADLGICEYVDARDFTIYHDHPAFNPGVPMDSTYEWENAPENYRQGHELFIERNPNAIGFSFAREEELAQV